MKKLSPQIPKNSSTKIDMSACKTSTAKSDTSEESKNSKASPLPNLIENSFRTSQNNLPRVEKKEELIKQVQELFFHSDYEQWKIYKPAFDGKGLSNTNI